MTRGFLPSNAVSQVIFDGEGSIVGDRRGPPVFEEFGDSNSAAKTEAEQFGSIAPFLKRNKASDALRRNYVVQPGGAILFEDKDRERPLIGMSPDVLRPGHDGQPGRGQNATPGRHFTVGDDRR